ncbi:MAG: DUF4174 domain-containing protein [Bacteroidota bacterium]
MSQDLAPFRWENRLVILLTPSEESNILKKQLLVLKEDIHGLKERKIVLIHSSETESKIMLPEPKPIQLSESERNRFKSTGKPFTFILIGLDGGIKLRRHEVVSREYLYALIDGMPMRRTEMREKRKKY